MPHLIAGKLKDRRAALAAADSRANRLAPGGQLVEDRHIQFAVQGQGQGARDGRGRHHEQIGLRAFLVERAALHHPKAVLLVDDRQPQASKLYLLLNQRVRAHRNVGRAAGNGRQPLLPQCPALAAFEENRRQPEGSDEGLNGKKVLLGEDLGRGHHGRLVAILHGRQHRAQPHQGLARADVALDEAVHNLGTLHLHGDLGDDPALGARWGKRQGIPQGRHQFFTGREG